MFALSSVLVAAALAQSAFAAVSFTDPTATAGFTGGQPATIQWIDDNNQPSLSVYGQCILSIYTGNSKQQTSLQTINSSIDPNAVNSFAFTVDATIGPDGDEYFIRMESLQTKDPNDPTGLLPLLAFSHTFTLSGMTGVFNASVQSQIDGQSTAPIGGSAAAPAATGAAATPSAAPNAAPSATVAGSTAKPSGAASSGVPKTSAGGSGSATAKGAAASPSGKSAAVPTFGAARSLWLGVATGVVGAFVGAALL